MIPIYEPSIGEAEIKNVTEAVASGWVSSKGAFIPAFEQGFADYCGMRYGVATSNGTVALHLALTALGIGDGDEVIVPTLTFIATANAVRYTGAMPVFVDADPEYWCIDPDLIEAAVTPKTRAIIPVHLYGHPCDMDTILEIARRYDLAVIEDAAEAHGAEYKGKKVGSFSRVSCFSFYGNKLVTTGEGGMCLTDDDALAEKMRILRDHGMNPEKRYWHDVVGFNYRMTNLQAAIGVAQLGKIDSVIREKHRIAAQYAKCLAHLADDGKLTLPVEKSWAGNVFWLYSVLVEEKLGLNRDELMQKLADNDIDSRPLFYPVTSLPPYRSDAGYPVAESLSRRGISLPSSVTLSDDDIEKIAEIIG